jgi:glucose/arabinose dehydrogenase
MKKIFCLLYFTTVIYSQNYIVETLINFGFAETVAFDFIPGNRIIVTQQTSSAKVFSTGGTQLSIFWNFSDSLFTNLEAGVLGVCLDPNFNSNHYIYIYYTNGPDSTLRIVRFTENSNTGTNPSIIFKYHPANGLGLHVAGNLHFGTLGKLFIAIGDRGQSSNA